MSVAIYVFVGVGILVIFGFIAALFLAAAKQPGQKRREELKSRRIARQPWDARSADGRGNR